jgi:hypothetical protein
LQSPLFKRAGFFCVIAPKALRTPLESYFVARGKKKKAVFETKVKA